jgi:hypothetical protein
MYGDFLEHKYKFSLPCFKEVMHVMSRSQILMYDMEHQNPYP